MDKTSVIQINFSEPVNLPDGFEQTLTGLISMACQQYERENPKRVMWVAGQGCQPLYDEPNEPEYNCAIYQIDVSEREDLYGKNINNPDKELLRLKLQEARKKRRASSPAGKAH